MPDPTPLSPAQRRAAAAVLAAISDVADELGRMFVENGHELAIVGGRVRDVFLGRSHADLDLATDAPPERVLEITRDWADTAWQVGIAFGTVGLRKSGTTLEITTYRSEEYARHSRKPDVTYGTSLVDDLSRRDFTVNAMAVRLPHYELVDPFGGLADLRDKVLRTPGKPEDSFGDDPLRMLRAARFVAELGLAPLPELRAAMVSLAPRLEIVSAERIRAELERLLLADLPSGASRGDDPPRPPRGASRGDDPPRPPRGASRGDNPRGPSAGIALLVETGVAEHFLPEVPRLQLEVDEHHRHKDVYRHSLTVLDQVIGLEGRYGLQRDLRLRLAALLHDIGKPRTRSLLPGGRVAFHHHDMVGAKMARSRLKILRFPSDVIADVAKLIELHLRFHGFGTGEWTDSAVRRYVTDAGPLLTRLHALTRADCTTRNRAKAARLERSYDELERRIEELAEQEELARIRPDLNGNEIMELLGIPPGPLVGRAYTHLRELRLERGPLGRERAVAELLRWAEAEGFGTARDEPPDR